MINLLGADAEFGERIFYEGVNYLSPDADVNSASNPVLQAAAVHIKNPDVASQIPVEKITKIMNAEPAAIVLLDSTKWRAQVDSGYPVENINSFLKSGLKQEVSKYTSESNKILTDLVIPPATPVVKVTGLESALTAGLQARGSDILKVTDQDGQRVNPRFASRLKDAVGVAKRFPELWEGSFDSPEEYVSSLIVPKREAPAEKAQEEAPELSFQENEDQVNALRVAAFRKKHGSDVDVLTDEEILKGLA